MVETPWYEVVATIATISTPILLLLLSGVGWMFKNIYRTRQSARSGDA